MVEHHNYHDLTNLDLIDEIHDVLDMDTLADDLQNQAQVQSEIELQQHFELDGDNLTDTRLQQLARLNTEDWSQRHVYFDTLRMDNYDKTPSYYFTQFNNTC